MRILAIGDSHGKVPRIYFKEFDVIIAPGDFCSDAPRKYMFQALREKLQNPESKVEWYDLTGKKRAKIMIEKSIKDGRKILEYLNSFGVPVYIVPGNGDWTKYKNSDWDFLKQGHYKKLIQGLGNIIDVHNRLIGTGDYQIIGYGISSGPEYPQYKEDIERLKPKDVKKIKREYERNSRKIASLFEKATKPVIFLSHNVPFNTPIDKITNKDSPRYGYHYGSIIAKEMVEKYQPLVCIGVHMHEHFGKCNIGKTVCINSGFGPHVNVLMKLDGSKIKNLEFYKKERR